MTLAAAMRAGAAMRPQAYGQWFSPEGGSCAVGAVYEAACSPRPQTMDTLCDAFPQLMEMAENPVTGTKWSVFSIITHLNDQYDWSRERIADWVESLATAAAERKAA